MSRAALIALLVASALGGSLYAQRGGARFHGNVARPAHSVLPDGAAFRVSAFSNPVLQEVRTAATLGSYFAPYGDLFGTSDRMVSVMNEVTSHL